MVMVGRSRYVLLEQVTVPDGLQPESNIFLRESKNKQTTKQLHKSPAMLYVVLYYLPLHLHSPIIFLLNNSTIRYQ